MAGDEAIPLHGWQRVSLFELPPHRYFLYRNVPARIIRDAPADGRDRARYADADLSYAAA